MRHWRASLWRSRHLGCVVIDKFLYISQRPDQGALRENLLNESGNDYEIRFSMPLNGFVCIACLRLFRRLGSWAVWCTRWVLPPWWGRLFLGPSVVWDGFGRHDFVHVPPRAAFDGGNHHTACCRSSSACGCATCGGLLLPRIRAILSCGANLPIPMDGGGESVNFCFSVIDAHAHCVIYLDHVVCHPVSSS